MAAAAADPSYYNHLALHIRPSQPLQYNPFFRSLFGFIAALLLLLLPPLKASKGYKTTTLPPSPSCSYPWLAPMVIDRDQ